MQVHQEALAAEAKHLETELDFHNRGCQASTVSLHQELSMLQEDLGGMQEGMSGSLCVGFLLLLECRHPKSGEKYITFGHNGLRKMVEKLGSKAGRRAVQRRLAQLSTARRGSK